MYGNRFYTDDIIRVYVGALIRDTDGTTWLISGMERNGVYSFFNLITGHREKYTWRDFKFTYYPVERVGKVKGMGLLEGEDWLCHDKRCYPGVLADGCSGCMYSKLTKEKKRYFEPDDIVWVPSEKRKRNVIESSLFYQREKGGTPIKLDSVYSIANKLNNLIWSVRFRLERYPVSDQYYRWDQVRLVKRQRHLINPSQLDHICNDLCLFGPYSKTAGIRCWECETGKIWRQIQR
jgi:hypothetical protein